MATKSHTAHVTAWLAQLANLTAGNMPLSDSMEKIGAMAAQLANDFPDPASFTAESRRAATLKCDFFPSYSKIHGLIADWWDQHRPASLPSPAAVAPMPDADRPHVDAWLRAQSVGEAAADLAARLAIVRRYAPAGFAWLVANDLTAAAVARRRGWIGDEAPATLETRMRAAWDDRDGVVGKVAGLTARTDDPAHGRVNARWIGVLGAQVAKWAPQHAHLVPGNEPLDTSPVTARKPTPQQQAATRADDGIVRVDRPPDPPADSAPPPRPLTNAQLLAACEAIGQGNSPRAQMLRQRLAEHATQEATS